MTEKIDRANNELLILFTRFPKPGQVKTRLIPALGPYQAAKLQRIMTGQSINQAIQAAEQRGTSVEVHFLGGDEAGMKKTFETPLPFRKQTGQTLGQRLVRAFKESFARQMRRVVIIGTDCPSLEAGIMTDAMVRLESFDVVVGPAVDGGFYLIGLSGPHEKILEEIDWGTEQAFRQLIANAGKKGLSTDALQYLRDVDEPGDLAALASWIRRELA